MNVYQRGVAGLGSDVVDVKMPAAIRDEILTIGRAFAALDADVKARRLKLPPQWIAAWYDFRDEWNRFAADHAHWYDNVWYASYEKALEYRQRLDAWRQQFVAQTGPTTAPALSARPPEAGESIPWKTIAYGGLAVAGLYGLAKVLGGFSEAKREVFGTSTVPDAVKWVRLRRAA